MGQVSGRKQVAYSEGEFSSFIKRLYISCVQGWRKLTRDVAVPQGYWKWGCRDPLYPRPAGASSYRVPVLPTAVGEGCSTAMWPAAEGSCCQLCPGRGPKEQTCWPFSPCLLIGLWVVRSEQKPKSCSPLEEICTGWALRHRDGHRTAKQGKWSVSRTGFFSLTVFWDSYSNCCIYLYIFLLLYSAPLWGYIITYPFYCQWTFGLYHVFGYPNMSVYWGI